MKLSPRVVNTAFVLWVVGTLIVPWFLSMWENVAWFALGAVISKMWLGLPQEPKAPVEPLPYADQYRHREVPRQED